MSALRPIPVITDASGVIHRMVANGAPVGQVFCKGERPDAFAVVTEAQSVVFHLPGCGDCWAAGHVEWTKAVRS